MTDDTMPDHPITLVGEFLLDLWGREKLCQHLLTNVLLPGTEYVGIITRGDTELARFTGSKDNMLQWFDAVMSLSLDSEGSRLSIFTETNGHIQFGESRTYEVRDYGDECGDADFMDEHDYATVLTGATWDDACSWVDKQDRPDMSNLVIHPEPPPPFKVVCVVLWDRAYGGPEEGGWWYDTMDPDNHEAQWLTHEAGGPWLIRSDEQASAKMLWLDALLKEKNVNGGRHNPNSVLSQGHYVAYCFDGYPCALPREKPHYE